MKPRFKCGQQDGRRNRRTGARGLASRENASGRRRRLCNDDNDATGKSIAGRRSRARSKKQIVSGDWFFSNDVRDSVAVSIYDVVPDSGPFSPFCPHSLAAASFFLSPTKRGPRGAVDNALLVPARDWKPPMVPTGGGGGGHDVRSRSLGGFGPNNARRTRSY